MRVRFRGIDNLHDPKALVSAGDKGSLVVSLVDGVNIVVTRDGYIARRDGFTKLLDLPYHSLIADGGTLYGVYNGTLYKNITTTQTAVLALGSDAKLVYDYLPNGWIVFSNGEVTGYISDGTAQLFPYPAQSYLDEAGNSVPTFKSPLPGALAVSSLFGKIYLSVQAETEVWLINTDAWDYDGYRATDSFLRWSGVFNLLVAVDDGLWVSVGNKIYWIAGDGSGEIAKAEYAAVKGTAQIVMVNKTGLSDRMSGERCAIVATKQGLCALGNGGAFVNLSGGQVAIPQATDGVAWITEQDGQVLYVVTLNGTSPAYNSLPNAATPPDPATWCVNLANSEHTRFAGIPAINSVARVGSIIYCAASDGLYGAFGGTDNEVEIDTPFVTGDIEFATGLTHVTDAMANGIFNYASSLSLTASPDGKEAYAVSALQRNAGTEQRFRLPRGSKGRFWQFTCTNTAGTYFMLRDMDLTIQRSRSRS